MSLSRLLILTLLVTVAVVAAPDASLAQSRGEEEARRQLEFAREEVDEGNFEKALTSADSALRLFPALYEAYVYKALAYEGLGKLKMAESFLLTYIELRGAPGEDTTADEALERIQEKLGQQGQGSAETPTDDPPPASGDPPAVPSGVTLDDMPDYPRGSEEFLAWLVLRQQTDTWQTRRTVGASFTVGGLVLAGVGAGLIVSMSLASAGQPNNANIEAVYAAGIASTITGGTFFIVGLPTVAASQGKLRKLETQTAALRPRPRLEVGAAVVAVRF